MTGLALVITALGAACGSSEQGPEAFCDQVPAIAAVTSEEELVGRGGVARMAELVGGMERLRDVSPEEIRTDVTTLVEVTTALRDALVAQDGADEKARTDALADLTVELDRFEAASAQVTAYARRICGVNLNELPAG